MTHVLNRPHILAKTIIDFCNLIKAKADALIGIMFVFFKIIPRSGLLMNPKSRVGSTAERIV